MGEEKCCLFRLFSQIQWPFEMLSLKSKMLVYLFWLNVNLFLYFLIVCGLMQHWILGDYCLPLRTLSLSWNFMIQCWNTWHMAQSEVSFFISKRLVKRHYSVKQEILTMNSYLLFNLISVLKVSLEIQWQALFFSAVTKYKERLLKWKVL